LIQELVQSMPMVLDAVQQPDRNDARLIHGDALVPP
jgi:hypothetical protein